MMKERTRSLLMSAVFGVLLVYLIEEGDPVGAGVMGTLLGTCLRELLP